MRGEPFASVFVEKHSSFGMATVETIGRTALRIRADNVGALFEAEPKRRFFVSNFSSEDVFARGFARGGSL